MASVDPSTYGDRMAEVYDDIHQQLSTPEVVDPMVDLLADLAGDGLALELGIGTGRIALPLAQRGVEVHGLEVSEAMVAQMRDKPGGVDIPVTMGDFTQFDLDGRYSLVYVVFNTLFALPSQDTQVECFRNVASHLSEGGVFLLEAFVPDMTRFDRGQRISAGLVETDRVAIDLQRHDPVTQTVASSHIYITPEGLRMYPVNIRYAWPSELDLMARLAGMKLRDRWSDWRGAAFTAASTGHVSAYEME